MFSFESKQARAREGESVAFSAADIAYYKRAKKILHRLNKKIIDERSVDPTNGEKTTAIDAMVGKIAEVSYLSDTQKERRAAWYKEHRANPGRYREVSHESFDEYRSGKGRASGGGTGEGEK